MFSANNDRWHVQRPGHPVSTFRFFDVSTLGRSKRLAVPSLPCASLPNPLCVLAAVRPVFGFFRGVVFLQTAPPRRCRVSFYHFVSVLFLGCLRFNFPSSVPKCLCAFVPLALRASVPCSPFHGARPLPNPSIHRWLETRPAPSDPPQSRQIPAICKPTNHPLNYAARYSKVTIRPGASSCQK